MGLLRAQGITQLLDIRPCPDEGPPRFHRHHLAWMLPGGGIHYDWLGDALGGTFPDEALPAPLGLDRREAMHRQPAYLHGWRRLLQALRDTPGPACLLGSAEDPLPCHRHWLIGQDLADLGVEVLHIRKPRKGRTQVLKVLPTPPTLLPPLTERPTGKIPRFAPAPPPPETWTDPIRPTPHLRPLDSPKS